MKIDQNFIKKYALAFTVVIAVLVAVFTLPAKPAEAQSSQPYYLQSRRVYDQETSMIAWNNAQWVFIWHFDNTSTPDLSIYPDPYSGTDNNKSCGGNGCNEWVTQINNGGNVWGRFIKGQDIRVQTGAGTYNGGEGNGYFYAYACGTKFAEGNMYYGSTLGFVNSSRYSIPTAAECTWQLNASNGKILFRALDFTQRPEPPVVTLTIDGTSTVWRPEGTAYTLAWTSGNATSCNTNWAGGVALNGSQWLSNVAGGSRYTQYTYTLTCSGSGGSSSASVTAYVYDPTSADIQANWSNGPIYVTTGASTYIYWAANSNVQFCDGSNALAGMPRQSYVTAWGQYYTINSNSTFTVTCYNDVGVAASDSVTVYPVAIPGVDVKINGYDTTQYFTSPASFNATWTSTNASSCSGSGSFTGESGTQNGTTRTVAQNSLAAGTYTYTMTCYNLAGSAVSDSVTAYIYAPPTVDVKVNGLDTNQTFISPASYNATWISSNATSCSGMYQFAGQSGTQNGITKTVPQSNMTAGTYIYKMTCYNAAGAAAVDSVIVTVNPPNPTVDVKVNSQDYALSFTAPAFYTVTWISANATSCTTSSDFGSLQPLTSNGVTTTLAQNNMSARTYIYSVTCQNSIGVQASDSITVNVVLAPTVDVKINGSDTNLTFAQPASYNATWISTNASSCAGTGAFSTQTGTSNNITKTVPQTNMAVGTYVYTMNCQNAAGTVVSDTVTVTVINAPPTVDLKVDSSDGPISKTIVPGYYTLSWTSTNAATCTASTNPSYVDWTGSVSFNGSKDLNNVPWGTYVHTITCTNAAGSATDSVTVTIGQPLIGRIYSQYTGLVLNGPSLPAPYGPLSCQRLYGTISGGVPPYSINIYVYSATRGDAANGVLYNTLSSSGSWENTPTGNPVVCTAKLFGTDFLGQWNAYIVVADRDGRTYNTKSNGTGQGYLPVWVVGKPDIHDTP